MSSQLEIRHSLWKARPSVVRSQDEFELYGSQLVLDSKNLSSALRELVRTLGFATRSALQKLKFCDRRLSLHFEVRSFWEAKT